MANGVAVARLLPAPELPSALPFDESLGGIEGWVGAILVAISEASAKALQEVQESGQVSAATQALGGDLVARLHKLQELSCGRLDFSATVHQQARLQLRVPPGGNPDGIETFASSILTMVAEVSAARAGMN